MSSMNLATQKRLGVLPKTEDTLTYKGHIYGNNHRGFRGRRPTPIASNKSPGFFGVHGLGAANGDGKLHYFGDGPGQADLPMNGFYGIGMADLDYQAGNMLIADPTENQPTNPAGIYGGLPKIGSPVLGAGLIAAGLFIANRNNNKKDPIALALLAGGAYTFVSGASSSDEGF